MCFVLKVGNVLVISASLAVKCVWLLTDVFTTILKYTVAYSPERMSCLITVINHGEHKREGFNALVPINVNSKVLYFLDSYFSPLIGRNQSFPLM